MFQKIEDEINKQCQNCPQNNDCIKRQCVVYRIKILLHSVFNPSKINIDDFFETEDKKQISIFDLVGGDEA